MNQDRFDNITRAFAARRLSRRQILTALGAGVLLSGPLGALWQEPASARRGCSSTPKAPSNLRVEAVDCNSIQLWWKDNSCNETRFEISNGVTSRRVPANVTTYTWGGLAPGTYMCFKVRAFNRRGYSKFTPSRSPYYVCTTTPRKCGSDPEYPFPQHVNYASGAIKPNNRTQEQLDNATRAFYDEWKDRYLIESGSGRGPDSGCRSGTYYVHVLRDVDDQNPPPPGVDPDSISYSEGHGYGMMITALMAGHDPDARTYFDGLYQFFKDHPSTFTNDLMGWNQVATGCGNAQPTPENGFNDGSGTATDGDLDIAYALLLAHSQWGSDGGIDYLQEASNVIYEIMYQEIEWDTWLPFLADGREDWLQDPEDDPDK